MIGQHVASPSSAGSRPTPLARSGVRWLARVALLRHDLAAVAAAIFLAIVFLAALLGPLFIGPSATTMNLDMRNLPPSLTTSFPAYLFGADPLGRDLLARIILAARVSLGIAAVVVAVSVVIGMTMGTLSGYFGGWWDDAIMRFVDIFMGFPSLLLVMVIIYAVGPGALNLAVVLIATRWMLYARVARAEVLRLRQFEYVEAARALGAGNGRILRRHLVPNLVPTITTLAIFEVAAVILAEAGLSFLGLGVPENSWGRLIAEGQQYISTAWWLVTFPGLAILLTTMSLAVLGNSVVVLLDPGQRARATAQQQVRTARP